MLDESALSQCESEEKKSVFFWKGWGVLKTEIEMFLSKQGFLFGEVQSSYRLKHHSYEDWPGKYTLILIYPPYTVFIVLTECEYITVCVDFYHVTYIMFL